MSASEDGRPMNGIAPRAASRGARGDAVRWLVVWSEPNRERTAAKFLAAPWNNCVVFLPIVSAVVIRRHRLITEEHMLFPRYLFVRNDGDHIPRVIKNSIGVADLVVVAGQPATVGGDMIQKIRARLAEGLPRPSPFEYGERVVTANGLDAIFLERVGETRALLLIKLLGRPVETVAELTSLSSSDSHVTSPSDDLDRREAT